MQGQRFAHKANHTTGPIAYKAKTAFIRYEQRGL